MAAEKRKSVDVDEINVAAASATCANGCGFFGNPSTAGMCSKCYLEHAATAPTDEKKMAHQAVCNMSGGGVFTPAPRCAPPVKKARLSCTAAAVAPCPDGGVAATVASPVKPVAANRCTACRKKVGLLGFRCCCGDTFCSVHRYAEKHGCTFDYKRVSRERIAKNNPVVIADKIVRI